MHMVHLQYSKKKILYDFSRLLETHCIKFVKKHLLSMVCLKHYYLSIAQIKTVQNLIPEERQRCTYVQSIDA